jgi:inner membrane protein
MNISKSQHRSLGLKLLLLGVIVILLGIPLALINFLSWERQGRADEVVTEVSQTFGGQQTLRGPFLTIPYSVTETVWIDQNGRRTSREELRRHHVVVSAETLETTVGQTVEMRHRAIYEIPVYASDIAMEGAFVIPVIEELLPEGAIVDWTGTGLIVAVSDLRAINEALNVRISGRAGPLVFEPGTPFDRPGWRGVRAELGRVSPGDRLAFTAELGLSGASALRFAASGRETRIEMSSDWPHPGFHGGFSPTSREIGEAGYTASWDIPYLARGVPAVWLSADRSIASLDPLAFGVQLVTPADGYQQVGRSLKYALFFIGFVMLMFFLVEANSGQRIHPAQYILAGMAQIVFYLLLLAISEHVNVGIAYVLAALATVALTGFYASTAFSDRRLGAITFIAMAVVYSMQYALILLEDFALLIGAILAFAGLAGTMLMTRNVDWYATLPSRDEAEPSA